MSIILDEHSSKFLNLAQNTKDHIFLTGNAGTGKSTVLRHFLENSNKKEVLVLAPTGTAAINVGGTTIHRFFQLGTDFSVGRIRQLSEDKQEYLKLVDTIIIDEVSMVRADLLDQMDQVLRRTLVKDDPFGGIQVIFVGDPYQLPPVVTEKEKEYFESMYKVPYFFGSQVWDEIDVQFIGLKKVHRQNGGPFLDLLNKIRVGDFKKEDLSVINDRVTPFSDIKDKPIFLTTTNKTAEDVNSKELAKLTTREYFFEADKTGEFPEDLYPAPFCLAVKEGAQIMFVRNHPELLWSNGTLGTVVKIGGTFISVFIPETGKTVLVEKEKWEITSPYLDRASGKLKQEVVGEYSQFPMKLAYAITIHKSQGKTFDKVYIDLGYGTFACGQAYVALSRGRSLEGTYMKKPVKPEDIKVDPIIIEFLKRYE